MIRSRIASNFRLSPLSGRPTIGLRTKEDPNDEEARVNCQFGSWLSAFGLQARVPMGASHAIGHVLGGTCDVPHYCGDDAERAALQQAGHGGSSKAHRGSPAGA